MKIDTTLKQWCPTCQQATRTVRCPTCRPPAFICAECRDEHDLCGKED